MLVKWGSDLKKSASSREMSIEGCSIALKFESSAAGVPVKSEQYDYF